MKIMILADGNNIKKIKHYIDSYHCFFEYSGEISLSIYEDTNFEVNKYDRVIVDIYNLDKASKLYTNTLSFNNLYLWFRDVLISVQQPTLLNVMLQRAFETKEWNIVKQINKIKVSLNYIMRKKILDTFPTQLQLETTSFCNAQCIMCSHYYAGNKGAVDMSRSMLEKLSELLPYLEIVIMHGNGEPFSSRLFDESVDTYSSYGIGLTSNTNLSILTDKHIEKINQCFVDIRVSCDACTKEIYEGIRTNLSFDNFVANCEKLKNLCRNVHKTMASVLMRQNLEQLPEMVEFAAKYGFSEIIFSNLGTSLIVGNDFDSISHFPYFAARQLKNALTVGNRCGIKVIIPSSFDLSLQDDDKCQEEIEKIHSIPFFKSQKELEDIRKFAKSVVGSNYRIVEDLSDCYWQDNLFECEGICEWCIEKPYIDLNGDVFVCCINSSYKVGNIFQNDSFMDIWNNETYQRIRELFYEGRLPGFCDNCQFILNGSLKKLSVPKVDESFCHRRHISKFYRDYCEENGYE